jgi:predicted TIM-barrel fold metal-dependent hydrolase
MRGVEMRIDAHVHYTPPSMIENLAGFAEREPYWGLLITPDAINHTEQGWATPERMIEDMDRAGVDRVVLLGESQQNHENCIARNDQGLDILRRWPERVIAFAVIQPRAGQEALDELERCLDGGMLGVGELGAYSQGFVLDHPDLFRLAEACIERNVPLNLHVSEEIGHFYLGKSTTPLRHYHRLAQRYPELKLILSHWGGGLFLYEIMPEVRQDLKNVWYDMAASPLLFPTEQIFKVALQCVDHKKLLFGTDYPLLIYPDRQNEPDLCPFVDEIDGLGLEPEVYADIMGCNAARLLGLVASEDGHGADGTEVTEGEPVPSRQGLTVNPIEEEKSIRRFMPVSAVADTWTETRKVFEKYGIPWRDSPVPSWEPIVQAAAVRGYGPAAQQRLVDELNTAAGLTEQQETERRAYKST